MASGQEKGQAMKALMYSYNLLGDGLQTGPALRAFYAHHIGHDSALEISLATHDNYIAGIYSRMGVPLKQVITEPVEDDSAYDFVFNFDISRAFALGIHNTPCALCYAAMLGMPLREILPVFELTEAEDAEAEQAAREAPYVLFQPYSMSCSSWTGEPANKRWKDEDWADVYGRVVQAYCGVKVLGGVRSQKEYLIPGIPEAAHCFGLPLGTVAAMQKHAAAVLTLDNGVAHLAASQRATMVKLYPQCLPPQWMSNLSNPNGLVLHWRPEELSADYVWEHLQVMLERRLKKSVGGEAKRDAPNLS